MLLPSLLLALAATAQAAPTLNYPLMDQMPPVARVGSEFVFDLFPTTFNSTSTITYNTTTLPSWLSWDTPTLSFYGTPTSADQGQEAITVTATDASGSTRSNFTLIVTNYSVPAVHQSFYTQINEPNLHDIASASILPAGTGVSIPPWWSFSLGFQPETFRKSKVTPINNKLYYAARLRGSTGLPSWLNFDNSTFTFTGVAPGEGSYTIVATGTDFWGYTGAQTSFVIEVGEGEGIELARGYNFTDMQGIARGKVDYEVDLSGLLVGGEAVEKSDVTVMLNGSDYDWLSVDSTTNVISGTVPDSYQNGTSAPLSVPITIASTNTSNTLYLTTYIGLDIAPYFFSAYSLPNGTVSPLQQYSFDLSSYRLNNTATVNASVSPTDAASWLTFHTDNLTLIGTAPESPKYNQVEVVFQAAIGSLAATTTLDIAISGVSDTSGSTGTAPVPSTGGSSGLSKGAKIAIGVVLGLLLLALIIVLLWFLCCRRRRRAAAAAAEDEKRDEDGDLSNRASVPDLSDPFRMSTGRPRGMSAATTGYNPDGSPTSFSSAATAVEKPHRMDGMKGIIEWDGEERLMQGPNFSGEGDFVGYPDVIATQNPIEGADMGSGGSSFTGSVMSESSRASWQSKESFQWSSGEGFGSGRVYAEGDDLERASLGAVGGGARLSTANSIPRPRPDFTPRYPRHRSPTALLHLTNPDDASEHSFSEFHSSDDGHGRDSLASQGQSRSGFESNSMMGTGSVFQSQSQFGSGTGTGSLGTGIGRSGMSGLSQIGESTRFGMSETDGTDGEGEYSGEGEADESAVVATARRASLDARQQLGESPRLVQRDRAARDGQAMSGMFDDAESRRSTMYGADGSVLNGTAGASAGLGYPNSVIYFGSPQPQIEAAGAGSQRGSIGTTFSTVDEGYTPRASYAGADGDSSARTSTIRAVPFRENPLSPPLPQASSFIRHRRTNTAGSGSSSRPAGVSTGTNNGHVAAAANETFSMHPSIHPPPTVSLSAATWSSNPPSTYRAEVEGGEQLPSWLHFDARELELWGVPPMRSLGDKMVVRIVERLPRDARRADPMSFGYEPPQEREVGRVLIEVTDKLKSPQFALEGSPHAL